MHTTRREKRKEMKNGGGGVCGRSILYRDRKRFIRLIIVLPLPPRDRCPLYLALAKHRKSFQRWNLLDSWSFPIVLLHFYPRRGWMDARGDISILSFPFREANKGGKERMAVRPGKLNFITWRAFYSYNIPDERGYALYTPTDSFETRLNNDRRSSR